MKIEEFLSQDEPGFHIAKISQEDVRAEDVLEFLKKQGVENVIYLPDYIEHFVSTSAIAYKLLKWLDEEFFLMYSGLMGVIFQSLLPGEELPGEFDVYPDIDEKVVFFALMKAMDYAAKKQGIKKVVWVFGRIDFSRNYIYRRFMYFLRDYGKSDSVVHLGILVGATAEHLEFTELEADIKPRYPLRKLLESPLTDKHKMLLGVLALVSDISSGHVTVTFVARMMKNYPWTENVFEDLIRWEILEQYGSRMYAFTNLAMKDYALKFYVSEEVENIALSLMRKDFASNMKFIARLSVKQGCVKKALASITLYARAHAQMGRYRKAYNEIIDYYKSYREYLNKYQKVFLLKLASACEDYDVEFISDIAYSLIREGNLPIMAYVYLASVMPYSESYIKYWRKLLEHAKQIEDTKTRSVLLLSAFHYLWRMQKITQGEMKDIASYISCVHVHDTYTQVLLYDIYARLSILIGNFKEAKHYLSIARSIIEDKMLWFMASSVYNNLFVSLYRDKTQYPRIRLIPLLFEAFESAVLYRTKVTTTALSNYLLISSQSGEPYSSIERVFTQYIPLVEAVLGKESVADLYYAMSFVADDYGYFSRAIKYIDMLKTLIDDMGYEVAPYKLKMNYYHAQAHALMQNGYIEEAEKVLDEWQEKLGLYGEAFFKYKTVSDALKTMEGLKEPDENDASFVAYRYFLAIGSPKKGIEYFQGLIKNYSYTGDMLSMAQAKEYMAYFYEMLGDIPTMKEHLYDALVLYHVLESARVSVVEEMLDIDTRDMPTDMLSIYVSRMMLMYLLSDIAYEDTIEDLMADVLAKLMVPATGMWMLFQWENFTDFVGFDIAKGITHKFRDFYISPYDIKEGSSYFVSKSPSYVYVVSTLGNAKLILYAENRYIEGVFSTDTITNLKVYTDNIIGLLVKMKLSERAIIDYLTGLYSRWYILKSLKDEVHRYLRNNMPLSLLFIDIDNFKQVNDLFGHDVGDMVLEKVGKIIKESIRIVDMAGRYGGEEFLVILPETDEEGALLVAERIRKAVQENIDHDIDITVSIGIATLKEGLVVSPEEFIKAADTAMYEAKKRGKNRVVVYKWLDIT